MYEKDFSELVTFPVPGGMCRHLSVSRPPRDPEFVIDRAQGSCECCGTEHRVELRSDGVARPLDHGDGHALLAAIGDRKEDRSCFDLAARVQQRLLPGPDDGIPASLLKAAKMHSIRSASWNLTQFWLPGAPGCESLRRRAELTSAARFPPFVPTDINLAYADEPWLLNTCLVAMNRARAYAQERQAICAVVLDYIPLRDESPLRQEAPEAFALADPMGRVCVMANRFQQGVGMGLDRIFRGRDEEEGLWALVNFASGRCQAVLRPQMPGASLGAVLNSLAAR